VCCTSPRRRWFFRLARFSATRSQNRFCTVCRRQKGPHSFSSSKERAEAFLTSVTMRYFENWPFQYVDVKKAFVRPQRGQQQSTAKLHASEVSSTVRTVLWAQECSGSVSYALRTQTLHEFDFCNSGVLSIDPKATFPSR